MQTLDEQPGVRLPGGYERLLDPEVHLEYGTTIVEHGHGPRGPGFVEAGQGGRQIDGIGHRASLPDRRLDPAPGARKGIASGTSVDNV
jgi:hypothetical protein